MARFRFSDDSIKKVSANIQAFGPKHKKRLARALEFWGDDTVAAIQGEIRDVGAFDQGQYHAATNRTPAEILAAKIRLEVRNEAEHAIIVEFGRRPGVGKPPPLLPLVGWASRKGIINLPRNISFGGQWEKSWAASGAIFRNFLNKRGGSSGGKKEPLDAEVRDMLIVRFIAWKIFEKGIKGRHPISRTIDRRAGTFARDIASSLQSLR